MAVLTCYHHNRLCRSTEFTPKPVVIQIKVFRTFTPDSNYDHLNNPISNNTNSYFGALHLQTPNCPRILSILRHAVAYLSVS